jgi:hypothetical protein
MVPQGLGKREADSLSGLAPIRRRSMADIESLNFKTKSIEAGELKEGF